MTPREFMPELHRDASAVRRRKPLDERPARDLGAPWEWRLAAGEVRRIEPAPVTRWIDVTEGRVWLTPTRDDDLADDHWLAAGERLVLPAGTAWVVEAWPSARVALHQAPPGARLC
jgi:hypothetical protein